MTGRSVLLGAALLTLPAHPAAAYAAPGDPAAGSPSGAVYELPFEKGRADAAPKSDLVAPSGQATGTGAASGNPDREEPGSSYYRTENNFGSSSQVPAAPAFGGSGAGGSGRTNPAQGRSGGNGSAEGAGGSGSGNGGNGLSASATEGADDAHLADLGNTSLAGSVALLGVIALVAVGVGLMTARARRSRTG